MHAVPMLNTLPPPPLPPAARTTHAHTLVHRTLHAAQDDVNEKWVTQLWLTAGLPKQAAAAPARKAVQRGDVGRDGKRKGFRF